MKPIGDLCLVVMQPQPTEKKTPAGIVIPSNAMDTAVRIGVVHSVGGKVETLKPADKVIVDPMANAHYGQWLDDDDPNASFTDCVFVKEANIMAVIE